MAAHTRHDQELMLWVSWLHLVEGMTQDAIAERLGLTRAKVNRLVAACRIEGPVRVMIDTNARFRFEAEQELISRFQLDDAYIIPTAADPATLTAAIGTAAGAYISAVLAENEILALGWGRTLDASVRGLAPRQPSGNTVVTMLGGLARSANINPYDIASRYSRALSAECYYMIAPILADSEETAQAFLKIPLVQQTLELVKTANVVLAGGGALSENSIEIENGLLTSADLGVLRRDGAVGNFCGHYFRQDGSLVENEVTSRRILISFNDIREIPRRILAAGGQEKIPLMKAVLNIRGCSTVITDIETANGLL